MMAKNPNDRYRTTKDLMEDLQYYEVAQGREELLEQDALSVPHGRESKNEVAMVTLESYQVLRLQNQRLVVGVVIIALMLLIETLFIVLKS
jgi:hypothetical protein